MVKGGDKYLVTDTTKSVSDNFEEGFLKIDLNVQIGNCDKYELAPLFERLLPGNQPILEAGCGSGRWVAWFKNHEWEAAGLDWSESLCDRAREVIRARFEAGDMREMPFEDGEFGSIVALGSVEHVPEGPWVILREFQRVLRSNGIAIITVPYNGPVRKICRSLCSPSQRLKRNPILRQIMRKQGCLGKTFKEAKIETVSRWASDYVCTEQGWDFFQYHFTKDQMRMFIERSGFEILEEFIGFGDEGVLHNFGRLAGVYDYKQACVRFSSMGKTLRHLIPVNLMGHMLCYVIRRK
jgi:ubiquinone/menaquinone biosynthesis C-methylase UbiE